MILVFRGYIDIYHVLCHSLLPNQIKKHKQCTTRLNSTLICLYGCQSINVSLSKLLLAHDARGCV